MTIEIEGSTELVIAGGVARLTLRFPERRNALATGVKRDLLAGLAQVARDPSVRAVVICGEGAHFCAGGDIKGMVSLSADVEARHRLLELQDIVRQIATMEKPVIAAVEGHAAGGGMGIAVACDVVIASDSAVFSGAFTRIGLMPDMGIMHTLAQRMGQSRARRFLMLAERAEAPEALRIGIADFPAPVGGALAAAMVLADDLASQATRAIGMTKSVMGRMPSSLEELLRAEADAQTPLLISDDFAEGRAAFAAKRSPVFRGR